MTKDEFNIIVAKDADNDLGSVLQSAVSAALGPKASQEDVLESLERSLQWRAGDTAAEDYMSLCRSGALDEIAGSDHEDELINDAQDQEERISAKVKAAKSIVACVSKMRAPKKKSASASTARKPVRFESSGTWTTERVQALLPHTKFGYRAMKDEFNKCYRVIANRQRWSTSKSWGPSGLDSVSVRIVLEKAWERHLALHPEESCPWVFEDLCVE